MLISQTSDKNGEMEKQRLEESERKSRGWKNQRREEKKKEDQRRERVRRKRMQLPEKSRKVVNHCVSRTFCGSRGLSRLAKATGAEPSSQMNVEKVRAVVARSTLRREQVLKLTVSERLWTLRC